MASRAATTLATVDTALVKPTALHPGFSGSGVIGASRPVVPELHGSIGFGADRLALLVFTPLDPHECRWFPFSRRYRFRVSRAPGCSRCTASLWRCAAQSGLLVETLDVKERCKQEKSNAAREHQSPAPFVALLSLPYLTLLYTLGLAILALTKNYFYINLL